MILIPKFQGVYYKPFALALGLMFFQQFCGINGVLFALEDIFKAAKDNLVPGLSSFLVTLVQVNRNPQK